MAALAQNFTFTTFVFNFSCEPRAVVEGYLARNKALRLKNLEKASRKVSGAFEAIPRFHSDLIKIIKKYAELPLTQASASESSSSPASLISSSADFNPSISQETALTPSVQATPLIAKMSLSAMR